VKYTVQQGDTLWLIARRFGVSLDELIEANPIIADPDYIQVGLIIEIPRKNNEYVVKRGDTMWLIAKRFGVSLDDLINANPQISDPNLINVGDVIYLPEPDMDDYENNTSTNQQVHINYINTKKKDTSPITVQPTQQNPPKHPVYQEPAQKEREKSNFLKNMQYVVKAGDTLFKIGKMFGVSLPNLIEANKHIEDPDKIYPGNKIIIPVAPPQDSLQKHEEEIKVKPSPATGLPMMPPVQMPAMPPMQIMPMPMPYAQTMPTMDMDCPMMSHCMEMMHMMQMNHMHHMNQMAQMMEMMQPMQMHCCPGMCPLMMMDDESQQVPEMQQQVQQEQQYKQHELQEKECHQQQEQEQKQEEKQVQKGKKVQQEQKYYQKEEEEQAQQEEQAYKKVQQHVQQNVKKRKRKGCKKCRGY
jgi:LysM repeat protein